MAQMYQGSIFRRIAFRVEGRKAGKRKESKQLVVCHELPRRMSAPGGHPLLLAAKSFSWLKI